MAINNNKYLQKLTKMKFPIIKDYFFKKTQEFDLQSKPLLINELHFFVEDVRLNKKDLYIKGWFHHKDLKKITFNLFQAEKKVRTSVIFSKRQDVADSLKVNKENALQFILTAKTLSVKSFYLLIQDASSNRILRSKPLMVKENINGIMPIDTPATTKSIQDQTSQNNLDNNKNYFFIEGVYADSSKKIICVYGWASDINNIWFESIENKRLKVSQSFLFERLDVNTYLTSQNILCGPNSTGFIFIIQGTVPKNILLSKFKSGKKILSSSANASIFPNNKIKAFNLLLSIRSPIKSASERFSRLEIPFLKKYFIQSNKLNSFITREFGQKNTLATLSIVISIYKMSDFLELQLQSFSNDEWLKVNAQIILVLDDPSIAEIFLRQVSFLNQHYTLPLLVILNLENLGFSQANNNAAKCVKTSKVIFMNDDVLPIKPLWAKHLCDSLDTNPDLGIVSPSLIFPDNSIQHIGMKNIFNHELNIFTNHHMKKHLQKSLDTNTKLTFVPLVSAACIAVRLADFNKVGQFSNEYILGDYEDSDLCLKFMKSGFKVGYLPFVDLIHFERQSISASTECDLMRVILNAKIYESKWKKEIDK